jgi:AcrR family transcriptional regulator
MATRPSKTTSDRIIKAASRVFAESGFQGASVRTIVARADVNQAAINYHFGSKEALYRAVLQKALQVLMKDDAQATPDDSREAALRRFVRQQLRPMTARDESSDHLRIFGWETVRPSPVFRKFMAAEAAPFFGSVTALVRRFLPEGTSDQQAILGALWLFGQCSIFVRNREQLANPPMQLKVDQGLVELLVDTITGWAIGGLTRPAVSGRTGSIEPGGI